MCVELCISGKDSCNGDSGGPLIARRDRESTMFLLGTVSSGKKVCGTAPGLYVNVNKYETWIRKTIGQR